MDFKSLVNKESFKAVLMHHLKNNVRAKFGNTISSKIQALIEKDENISPDFVIATVSSNISDSEEFPELLQSFLQSLNALIEDKDRYVPKDERQGYDSQCSSASSINTSSIDFLSPDQFENITQSLTNGVNAEKLEALETFCRLPTLEHLIKQSFWPAVENGLHNALSSDIIFLKEASLKLYTKMLSSSEPKVVQESYGSLLKHLLQHLLPFMNQNTYDGELAKKCKCTVEILAILNKFLRNISSHWLRYPQGIIEEITVLSISILSYSCKNSNAFPVWMCIALCDPKCKWLKNIMYGHVSRLFLLSSLEKDCHILHFALQFCENFSSADSIFPLNDKCCQKSATVAEITHILCFLSHLLQYTQGREVLNHIHASEISPSWINVLDLVMKCAHKLCSVTCFNCCAILCEEISSKWNYFWISDDISITGDYLAQMQIIQLSNIESVAINSIYFTIQCLCEMFDSFINVSCILESAGKLHNFISVILRYCVDLIYIHNDVAEIPTPIVQVCNCSLKLVKKILLNPSSLIMNSNFIEVLTCWWLKINSFSKTKSLTSNSSALSKHGFKILAEMEHKISDMSVYLLYKPLTIMISHNTELYETSLNILLEKMLKDIQSRNSVCPCDVSILSSALNCIFTMKSALNKSMVFKLSSVIWQLNTNDLENLPKIKHILEMLVPSIFSDLILTDMLSDVNFNRDIQLFHYILLFPSSLKYEYIMCEETNVLALQIISALSCSVHLSCILEAKFKLTNMLLEFQKHHLNSDGMHIIDPVSILQNHVLVKLFAIGGPRERVLPPETLEDNNDNYNWPLFENYPIPEIYYQFTLEEEIDLNISDSQLQPENLKSIFLKYIQLNKQFSSDLVLQLLKSSINTLEPEPDLSKTLNFITLESANSLILQEEAMVGLNLARRYGVILNLISEDDSKLELMLKAGKCLLGIESNSQFDVFVSTIHLICKSDIQISWLFLETFAKTSNSLFVWFERLAQASELNDCKYMAIHGVIMEQCDIIVKKSLPLVFSALQLSGILPSVIFSYWTMQCYWNFLDFIEIAHFILLTVLFSGDFAIYFFVSVLKHLQNVILKNAHGLQIHNILKKDPIKDYKVFSYISFMIELSDTFHNDTIKAVTALFKNKNN